MAGPVQTNVAPSPAGKTSSPSPALRPGAAPKQKGETAPGVMELKGASEFKPPAAIAAFLDERREVFVNVRFGNLAHGPVNVVRETKGRYHIRRQPVPLALPVFAKMAEALPGLTPILILNSRGEKLSGEIGLAAAKQVHDLESRWRTLPEMLGLSGFTISKQPKITSNIEGGSLQLALPKVAFQLGSAFAGSFSLATRDEAVTFSGEAAVDVKGLVKGALALNRSADGAITGKATLGLNLPKNISGTFEVAWDGQAITGQVTVGYSGEKLSGSVTLHLMEKAEADRLEAEKKAPEGKATPPAAAKTKAKPSQIHYVVFGEGDLNFTFTEWLNGNAHVIINPLGYLTIIGKITPQKEFPLFEPKDYLKPLFKFEARATYGLPVVGNIFIFGNVGMDLFANLRGKFYNIVVDGTYSTDPKQANNFTIRGSLNISAAAGARLRAEAGVGIEILSHDIKAGAGINGIAGIKAYAEATPIIGYREKVADGEDKKGEFFIRGELEIAAQPFLGLSGDLFLELDAPWWSLLSDDKWTWPLFNKEWPIGGSLGVGATVDYVFGSGQWPKLDFKPVEFSAEKFLTDLYEDKAKSGPGKEVEQKGKWQEKNSAAAELPPKVSPKGNAAPGKLPPAAPAKSKKPSTKKSGKPADPNAKTANGKTVRQLQEEAEKKGKKPKGKGEKPQIAWWKSKKLFSTLDGEAHSLYFVGEKGSASLTVASVPQSLKDLIKDKKKEAGKDKGKLDAIKEIEKLLSEVEAAEKLPEAKYAEAKKEIEADMNSIGPQLAKLLNATKYGSPENPLPIEYTKRRIGSYLPVYIGPKCVNKNKIPMQENLKDGKTNEVKKALTDTEIESWKEDAFRIRRYHPTKQAALPEGPIIGVTSAYQVEVGKVLHYKAGKTEGGKKINEALAPFGYWAGAEGRDGDHIVEMQIGGPNIHENLWPLDKSENRSSGSALKNVMIEAKKQIKLAKNSPANTDSFEIIISKTKIAP